MPVMRVPVSISQFSELMGIEPGRFVGVDVHKPSSRVTLLLEPEDRVAQTSGVIPALNESGKKIGGKKKGKK